MFYAAIPLALFIKKVLLGKCTGFNSRR